MNNIGIIKFEHLSMTFVILFKFSTLTYQIFLFKLSMVVLSEELLDQLSQSTLFHLLATDPI
jgi:hypothetical protein